MRKLAVLAIVLASIPFASAAPVPGEWQHWEAGNEIGNTASLQRGARNFMGYCAGCHSLKYQRYSRLGEDLKIPEAELEKYIVPAGAKKTDYITSALSADDANAWFGKAPPDLSLITRARGTDYVYQFLKVYYADPATLSGVNNLALPGTAMPHVLSSLQGVPEAVFETVETKGEGGELVSERRFVRFEAGAPGQLSPEDYDAFVRDTVNFLEYVGEPAKIKRIGLGIWVMLFLLAFTALAYLLKKEYWRDVK